METMDQAISDLKSPVRKLLRVFRAGRDGWKAKYRDLKAEFRAMYGQVRAVEKSRDKWKQEAKQVRRQLRQLQKELEQSKKSAAARDACPA